MIIKSVLSTVAFLACCLHGKYITNVPGSFAPLVVSQSGFRQSAQPSEQVLNKEFIRLYSEDIQSELFCYPSYYDISANTTLVYYETDQIVQRKNQQLQCELHNVIRFDNTDPIVPHCPTANETSSAYQLGLVDTLTNRLHVIAEGCMDNGTDTTIYFRSRLQHRNDAGKQLPLDAIRLHTLQPVDMSFNLFNNPEAVHEMEDFLKSPKEPDVAWLSMRADAIRTYETWDPFLWNAHKYGIDYLSYDASRVVQRLEPVVERLRDSLNTAGQMDFYSGYWDKFEVSIAASDADDVTTVEVPKYVWLVARAVADSDVSPLVYVVPNGPFPVDLCPNRCDQLVHCCAISDIGEQVEILKKLFN